MSRQRDPIGTVFFGIVVFVLVVLYGSWVTTQTVAARLGHQQMLGARVFPGHTYHPLAGATWITMCFEHVYHACAIGNPNRGIVMTILMSEMRTWTIYCGIGFIAGMLVATLMRRRSRNERVTTHGDARWAKVGEVREEGLVVGYVPKAVRAARSRARMLRTSGLLWLYDGLAEVPALRRSAIARTSQWAHRTLREAAKRRIGVTLGKVRYGNRWLQLRTDNAMPRGVILVGPPGSGKSSCFFIPSLVEWKESAFVYDPSFELLMATGEARRRVLKNRVLVFAPTRPDLSCHINFVDAVAWESRREVSTLQNVVKLLLDPSDRAGEGSEAHWIATGSVLLECTLAFLHYTEPEKCNLEGAYNFLSDPRWEDDAESPGKNKMTGVDKALQHMASTVLDTSELCERGWTDDEARPIRFHEHIRRSALMTKGKAANEKSGVVSTCVRFLEPYRDPIIAELTRFSDFEWNDLMNFEDPVTLYFCVPPRDISRLRAIVRLAMNLSIFEHMGDDAMDVKDGSFRFKHALAQFVDEFAQLGKQEQYMLQLSMVRKYGILPVLGIQDISQLWAAFGGQMNESIMSVMQYKVFMRPAKPETAEWISQKVLGKTTAENVVHSFSGARVGLKGQMSTQVTYNSVDLMSANALLAFEERKAIVKAVDLNPVIVDTLHYEDDPRLRDLVGTRDNPTLLWNTKRAPDRLRPPKDWRKQWVAFGYAPSVDRSRPFNDERVVAAGASNGANGVSVAPSSNGSSNGAHATNGASNGHAEVADVAAFDVFASFGTADGTAEANSEAAAEDDGLEPVGSVAAARGTYADASAQLTPLTEPAIYNVLDEFGPASDEEEDEPVGAGSSTGF